MSKITCLFLCAFILLTGAAQAQTGSLTVKMEGIKSAKGKMMMSLFDKADGFPSTHQKAFQVKQLPAQKGAMVVVFENLPAGDYALAVFHDENNDGKMNANAFGAPKEAWGASNNVRPTFSAPAFKDASFRHKQASHITIQVK